MKEYKFICDECDLSCILISGPTASPAAESSEP